MFELYYAHMHSHTHTHTHTHSAQFEHTLLITDTGVEMLTGKLPNSIKQFWDKQL